MRTLIEHTIEFAVEAANENLKNFTPDQAEMLKTILNDSAMFHDNVERVTSNVFDAIQEIVRKNLWETAMSNK